MGRLRRLRDRLRPRELKPGLRWALTCGLLICAVLGLHLLCLLIGTQDFSRPRFSSYFHEPVIFLLNLLPVLLLVCFTYFATNRAWLAFLLPGTVLVVMDFVSYFKVVLRGDPLVAEDFLTIGEGAGIVGQYTLKFPWLFFVAIGLLVGGTIVLTRYARGRFPKKLWWVRALAVLLTLLVGWGAWSLWYGDTELYDSMKFDNESCFNVWKDAELYASKGFVYSFLNSLAEAMPQVPDGYSTEKAQGLLGQYEDQDIPQKVNVVVTMLESYSDLSVFDSIQFTADPYVEFHALQEESYTGVLISDTLGGGTINAERAFLTGFTYPQPRYHRDTASYVRYFSDQGYVTEGAHPGYDWFYSRQKVNANLGFDQYYFNENHYDALLTAEHDLDGHADDALFFAERAEAYAARDQSQPYFSFSVSYQNHSPYADDSLTGEEYVSHDGISDGAYYTVNNYLSGIADTGKQVAAYVDTFRDDPEPVVLVFFGDHKPTLGAGNVYYEEMGVNAVEGESAGFYNLYSTPYLIWANDAAKALLDRDFTGQGRTISPCYLMAELFDCCGWEGSAWMQYQRQTREILPVVQSRGMYLTADPAALYTTELSPDAQAVLNDHEIVEYYVRKQKPG